MSDEVFLLIKLGRLYGRGEGSVEAEISFELQWRPESLLLFLAKSASLGLSVRISATADGA